MRKLLGAFLVSTLPLGSVPPVASAQAPPADPNAPPPMVVIFREEVKPGKGAAHTANEVGWAGMMAKAQWPTGWLGSTALTGPSEAWFFTGFGSLAEWDKDRVAQDAAESLSDAAKFSAQDGELLTRTSTLIGMFRPQLSYRPTVSLPKMRYFSIDTVVVKPGYVSEFIERWQEIIAAHTKANLEEHWAVYEITSGAQTGTYLFFYPVESLSTLDESGAKHRAAAYRDAMGETGRAKNNEMTRNAVVSQQNRILAFNPKMSHLSKEWIDADPGFWTVKPPPPPAAKKK
jgi:hypothetical protein